MLRPNILRLVFKFIRGGVNCSYQNRFWRAGGLFWGEHWKSNEKIVKSNMKYL